MEDTSRGRIGGNIPLIMTLVGIERNFSMSKRDLKATPRRNIKSQRDISG